MKLITFFNFLFIFLVLNAYADKILQLPHYSEVLDAIAKAKSFDNDEIKIVKIVNHKVIDCETTIADNDAVVENISEESSVLTTDTQSVDFEYDIVKDKSAKLEEHPSAQPEVVNNDIFETTVDMPMTEEQFTEDTKIDFWGLLDISMTKSAMLILKKHDIAITKANIDIIKNEYYPHLSLNYQNEYYHGFSRDGDASSVIGGVVYPATSQYKNSLSLNLRHELYRFGASDTKLAIAALDTDIVKNELKLEKERIAKELLANYSRALKAQENINYKTKILMIQDSIEQRLNRLHQAGKRSKIDVTNYQISIINNEKEIMLNRIHLLEAVKNIEILSNVKLNTESNTFSMFEPKRKDILSFEESALSKNIKLQIEKKLQEIELVKKDKKPALSMSGQYLLYGNGNKNPLDAIDELERNNWNVGIVLTWNIFDGFKTDNTIKQAKLEVEKLIEQYRLEKIKFESSEAKREVLKESMDTILRKNDILLDQIGQQREMIARLEKAGKTSTIEIDNIEIERMKIELDFKLQVVDRAYEDILGELII